MMATNTATQNIIQIESSTLDKLVQNITSGLHLKCILRIIFLFSLEPNNNSTLSTYHLNNDPIIRSLIDNNNFSDTLEEILKSAEKNNIITTTNMDPSNKRFSLSTSITLNTEETIPIDSLPENNVQENIFEIFEKNISPLTPIIAEELKKAKSEYSEEMIKKAIIESAKNNARSWRYISRILERWEGEGQKDGRTQRYPARTKRY